ncbi:MAG: flagellar export protein FliJ [Pseudomonadota bacterium]
MTKNSGKKLHKLAKLAVAEERKAAAAFAADLNQQLKHDRQLQELQRYREEYNAPLQSTTSVAMTADQAQRIVSFVTSLDQIINSVQTQAQETYQITQQSKERWHAAKGKVQGYESVIARGEMTARRIQSNREQLALEDARPPKS